MTPEILVPLDCDFLLPVAAADHPQIGITDILVTPFHVNSEPFQGVEAFEANIYILKQKAGRIKQDWPEAKVIVKMAGFQEGRIVCLRPEDRERRSRHKPRAENRDLLPQDMEMMAEVTYVHPICFKSPASIRLEPADAGSGLRVV